MRAGGHYSDLEQVCLMTVSSHTQRKSVSLAVYQPLVQYACSSTNFEPITSWTTPRCQVNCSCSNSPLQWRRYRSARASNLPPDYVKEQISSLASLEARWPAEQASRNARRFAPFVRVCPPLFVHTALQFRPIIGLLNLQQSASLMPSRLGHGLYKKNDRLKIIFSISRVIIFSKRVQETLGSNSRSPRPRPLQGNYIHGKCTEHIKKKKKRHSTSILVIIHYNCKNNKK